MMPLQYIYDQYLRYRQVSGLKESSVTHVTWMLHSLQKEMKYDAVLTQDYLSRWCQRRENESLISYRTRLSHINNFINFSNQRGWSNLIVPRPVVRHSYGAPSTHCHMLDEEELRNFFRAIDEENWGKQLAGRLNKIEIPVFYRLLYSTGMRITEARMLRKCDVNLNSGIITIKQTKGYNERIIALHDSLSDLLFRYEAKIETIIPQRNTFFPDKRDGVHCVQWVNVHFKRLWYKYNKTNCVAYSFRHNYATVNINAWRENDGLEVTDKLVALSKSMGHASIRSTMYYYHMTPWFNDIISNLDMNDDCIIPNIPLL